MNHKTGSPDRKFLASFLEELRLRDTRLRGSSAGVSDDCTRRDRLNSQVSVRGGVSERKRMSPFGETLASNHSFLPAETSKRNDSRSSICPPFSVGW